MLRHITAVIFIGTLLAGCSARADLAPITGLSNVVLEQDEQRIWNRSKEEQRSLDKSGLLLQDSVLEEYLNGVVKRLHPPEVYRVLPFRVKILRNPYLNAYALADGAIYVHSGILARMENEAQLATLLGHETVHATHRHAVRERRKARKTIQISTVILATFNLNLGEEGIQAAIAGHSRELESEADVVGLQLMVRAGYDPAEAIKFFQHLREDAEGEKEEVPFFFSSHPRIEDRISNYRRLLGADYGNVTGGVTNEASFRRNVRKLLLDTVELDLKRGRFAPAERNIAAYLNEGGNEPRPYYLLGELHRQRARMDDDEKAEENYQKAIDCDKKFAEAYRALGFLQYKRGEKRKARLNLSTYLSLEPRAPDRPYIEGYLQETN